MRPLHDRGVFWADPELAIDWPVAEEAAILSEKDRRQPPMAELGDWFHHRPPSGPVRRGDERPANAG